MLRRHSRARHARKTRLLASILLTQQWSCHPCTSHSVCTHTHTRTHTHTNPATVELLQNKYLLHNHDLQVGSGVSMAAYKQYGLQAISPQGSRLSMTPGAPFPASSSHKHHPNHHVLVFNSYFLLLNLPPPCRGAGQGPLTHPATPHPPHPTLSSPLPHPSALSPTAKSRRLSS